MVHDGYPKIRVCELVFPANVCQAEPEKSRFVKTAGIPCQCGLIGIVLVIPASVA